VLGFYFSFDTLKINRQQFAVLGTFGQPQIQGKKCHRANTQRKRQMQGIACT
jgi:hypothetical protein